MIRRSWINEPWVLGAAGVAAVLILWSLMTASGAVDKLFLPSPAAVLSAGQQQAQSGLLWRDSGMSL